MLLLNNSDTIVAISTPIGEGGIGIVRLSGKNALKIADRIFISANKSKPTRFKTYTTHYGWIVDRKQKPENRSQKSEKINLSSVIPTLPAGRCHLSSDKIIDEVLLTVMRSPKSYTKEDIVEINCHSGIVPLRKILDLVIRSGATLAEPGEFTKRAFLNSRIDLAQAEAVLDIIRSKTDESLNASLNQLGGQLSIQIKAIRQKLLDILAQMEAKIDFPEDVATAINYKQIGNSVKKILKDLKEILDNSNQGKILREGISMVICGLPNVGKSSLLNLLLKEEKAIVTPVAGTTRDAIEDIINIRGIPLKIFDTAGLLEPKDIIEELAVKKTHSLISDADLILAMFDGSLVLSQKDFNLMKLLKAKTKIAVINKIDLKQKLNPAKFNGLFNRTVKISALTGKGLKALESAIENLVWKGKVISKNRPFFTNIRHINLLGDCHQYLGQAKGSLKDKLSPEVVAMDIKEAVKSLDQITGEAIEQDLLDKIFSEFCIGK